MTPATFGPEWSASLRRGSERELDGWLAFAHEAADVADRIALGHFRRDLEITTKPDRSFVTEADQAIEREIRTRIADRWPDHGVVGEEYGTSEGAGTVRWYLDPIDGTHNFMRGVPLFGLLLALERDGELQLGVVSAPALGTRWWARRGGGAWATRTIGAQAGRPSRVAVSDVAAIADVHLVYGAASEISRSARAPGFEALLGEVWRDRGFGDFWGYALVAEGAADAMVEADASPWDLAAPAVLVEEAGGRMTDLEGNRTIRGRTALASNGRLHNELRGRLLATT
ncbi:MAG TPA: inositol monophosphatase family protein [Candidatus Limnocylindrales bacterium]|nr:inositol monophosphatase family protein [Candidatus Limnocylindrales bacterium]